MKILGIATAFIALVLAIIMAVNLITAPVETSRYESRFPIQTADKVNLEVRVFGDCELSQQGSCMIRMMELKERFRDALEPLNFAEFPKKLKLFLRPQINHMSEAGLYVDSVSVIVKDDEE